MNLFYSQMYLFLKDKQPPNHSDVKRLRMKMKDNRQIWQ